jgi:glucan phosphoethanolaminetransferase (alkaline phosphatase superfamily)
MLALPLYFLLIIYALFVLVVMYLMWVNLSHLLNTGTFTFTSLSVTLIMLALMLVIFFFTWQALAGVDWQESITIFNTNWFQGLFNPNTSFLPS